MTERRVDPDDGGAYTFEELSSFYSGKYKKTAIKAYWEECAPVKSKKARSAAASEPKAKAKVKVKAKAKVKAKSKKKQRIAILGGAFDPPTLNHLMGAAEVIHSGQADEVWLVPCGPRPDKKNLSPVLARYIMTQISVSTFFGALTPIFASDVEVNETRSLPTYDLLYNLRKAHPDKEFSFVIGTDWLQPGTDLRGWTSNDENGEQTIVTGDKLVSEFDFLVIERPGYPCEDMSSFGPRMKRLQMPEGTSLMEGNLSSTEVRKRTDTSMRIRQDTSLIEGLVTPGCLAYVTRHSMYFDQTLSPKRSAKKKNVAVFGGTFDPPTHSHMLALADILHSGLADEGLLVPCGPRSDKPDLRSPLVRYCMCEIAVNTSFSSSFPVSASDIEVHEKEAFFTYDLMCALKAQHPDKNFKFVVGSEWLQPDMDLRKWKRKDPETGEKIIVGDKMVNEFDFIILMRQGYEVSDLSEFGPRMEKMEMPFGMKSIESNLTSVEVRKRADLSYRIKGDNLRLLDGLVPSGVLNFMKRENIYRPKPKEATAKGKNKAEPGHQRHLTRTSMRPALPMDG